MEDYQKILSKNDYLLLLLRDFIKSRLNQLENQLLEELNEKFQKESRKMVNDAIIKILDNLVIQGRNDPTHFRPEIIVQLPTIPPLEKE